MQEEKAEEKAAAAESKKDKRIVAVETKKEEKAPASSGSIINSAKAEGHTRGVIAEHGEIEFHRCQGGFLPPNS